MSLNINSNFAAISNGALAAMKQSQTIMGKSIAHVSTGKKVNSAADGASAYVSSQIAKSDAQGYNGLNSGVQNGSSYLNAADKAMSSVVEMLTAMREKSLEYNSYSDKTSEGAIAAKTAFSSLYEAAQAAINVDVGTHDKLLSENQEFVFSVGFGETDDVGANYVGANKSKAAGLVAGDIGVMQNAAAGSVKSAESEGVVAKAFSVIDSSGMSNKYTVVYNGGSDIAQNAVDDQSDNAAAIFANTTTGLTSSGFQSKTGYIVDGYGNVRFSLDSNGKIKDTGSNEVGAYDVSVINNGGTGTNKKLAVNIENIKWNKDYVAKHMAASEYEAATKQVFTDPQKLTTYGTVDNVLAKEGIKVDDAHIYSIFFVDKNSANASASIDLKTTDGYASSSTITVNKGEGAIVDKQGNQAYTLKDGMIYEGTTTNAGTEKGYYTLDSDGVLSVKWTKEFAGTRGDVSSGGASSSLTVSWNSISKALDNLDISDSAGIASAIKQVSREQAKIGNGLNTLEYVSSHLTNMANVETEAYTTLTEADMAEEMTNYVKNNIYSQAAQAMIAQANQSMAQVLNLLQ